MSYQSTLSHNHSGETCEKDWIDISDHTTLDITDLRYPNALTGTHSKYPDIDGFSYHNPHTRGEATLVDLWQNTAPSRIATRDDPDPERIPGSASLITEGTREFVRHRGIHVIDFPRYYSRFDEYQRVAHLSTGGGVISPDYLERIVRLANGSGRIDTDTVALVLTDQGDVVAVGERGAWLIDPIYSTPYADPLTSDTGHYEELQHSPVSEVTGPTGIAVPEIDPTRRNGVQVLLTLCWRSDRLPTLTRCEAESPTDCSTLPSWVQEGTHRFEAEGTNDTLSVTGGTLARLGGDWQSKHRVTAGSYSETFYINGSSDKFFERVPVTAPPARIGEWVALDPNRTADEFDNVSSPFTANPFPLRGVVVGYDTIWRSSERVARNTTYAVGFGLEICVLTPELQTQTAILPIMTTKV
ncbi:hypothetical protein RYH80_18015 [Halobaculum sp. MBLA0147]|uniref:hypothetical protein n=1 Tax=Halobaculum sp. MBLA0147 TaxID=3079934 RepID=UPI003526B14B